MHQQQIRRSQAIESCIIQLQTWKPFFHHSKTLDSLSPTDPKPSSSSSSFKRPCLSDRTTTAKTLEAQLSRLSLFDDRTRPDTSLRWKRRRCGSRSVSGRSSDRSRRRCCSLGAGTCSDLPVATDSSGELFLNGGDGNWGSDVSEASRGNNNRREREERESLSLSSGVVQIGSFENQGNESGYGSEPGYRGDAEFGYGDEVDTEEDEHRMSWGEKFQGRDSKMEIAGENTLQKGHHRCRRKKHDVRMVDSLG